MTDLSIANLERVAAPNKRGNVGVLIGIGGTVYFRDSSDIAHRQKLLAWIGDLMRSTPAEAWRWFLKPQGGRPAPFSSDGFHAAMASITGESGANLEPLAYSGQNMLDAGHFSFHALTKLKKPTRLGYVSFTLPLSWTQSDPGLFPRLFGALCRFENAFHGYGGLWLIRHPDTSTAESAGPAAHSFAARFPGLELDNPDAHAARCEQGIKGVNWLTYVSDALLGQIGGRTSLADCSSTYGVEVVGLSHGLLFRAGNAPQLGDLEKNQVPEAYRTVARLLKPLKADHGGAIIEAPPGVDRLEFTRHWLSRFD